MSANSFKSIKEKSAYSNKGGDVMLKCKDVSVSLTVIPSMFILSTHTISWMAV